MKSKYRQMKVVGHRVGSGIGKITPFIFPLILQVREDGVEDAPVQEIMIDMDTPRTVQDLVYVLDLHFEDGWFFEKCVFRMHRTVRGITRSYGATNIKVPFTEVQPEAAS